MLPATVVVHLEELLFCKLNRMIITFCRTVLEPLDNKVVLLDSIRVDSEALVKRKDTNHLNVLYLTLFPARLSKQPRGVNFSEHVYL